MTNQSTFADKLERMLNRAETMRRTYLEMRMRPDDVKILIAALRAPRSAQEPVAWLSEYDGHRDATTDPDTVRIWRETLGRKITPLFPLTGDDQ